MSNAFFLGINLDARYREKLQFLQFGGTEEISSVCLILLYRKKKETWSKTNVELDFIVLNACLLHRNNLLVSIIINYFHPKIDIIAVTMR